MAKMRITIIRERVAEIDAERKALLAEAQERADQDFETAAKQTNMDQATHYLRWGKQWNDLAREIASGSLEVKVDSESSEDS